MKKGVIIYATVSGNTEIVAQRVQAQMALAGMSVELINCNVCDISYLASFDFVIMACGTYSHGLPQRYMDAFMRSNLEFDFQQKPCAAIGLGDSKYDHIYNMAAAEWLSDFIRNQNGKEVVSPLKINRSPIGQWAKVDTWVQGLLEYLQ